MTDAPQTGVRIRMYRQGHGDCFLLTFYPHDLQAGDPPFHVLIDYGKKSGSEVMAPDPAGGKSEVTMEEVWDDIVATTGGVIDLAVVTHEHEDHVSGFPTREDLLDRDHPFRKVTIRHLWLAWTEDGEDATANRIREDYDDKLVTLAAAAVEQKRLRADGEADRMIADLLELETGAATPEAFLASLGARGSREAFAAAGHRPAGYRYKVRVAGLRHVVGEENITFLDPTAGKSLPLSPDGRLGVKVYPLGPPRDIDLLKSLDPRSSEEFKLGLYPTATPGHGLFRAFAGPTQGADTDTSPFARRYRIEEDQVLSRQDGPYGSRNAKKKARELAEAPWLHYANAYNFHPDAPSESARREASRKVNAVGAAYGITLPEAERERQIRVAVDPASYRQLGDSWLDDAGELALRINSEVNNTSLVLLFELQNTRRTLLFTGDAQRGSWISWSRLAFDGIPARDLLGRCVFYKAGHHGSHNATLKGTVQDDYANLDWLATGDHAQMFTAMVPSNKDWAWNKKPYPWKHPLPAIEDALKHKAQGRVMTTSDLALTDSFPMPKASDPKRPAFDDLRNRTVYTRLYIEHHVPDVAGDGPETPPEPTAQPICRYPAS